MIKMGSGRRRMRGRGIGDWLRKAAGMIKTHQLVSRGAAALAPRAGQFGGIISEAGKLAAARGYGRRRYRAARMGRRYRGGALRLAGM